LGKWQTSKSEGNAFRQQATSPVLDENCERRIVIRAGLKEEAQSHIAAKAATRRKCVCG
jgi:hypothetical protein